MLCIIPRSFAQPSNLDDDGLLVWTNSLFDYIQVESCRVLTSLMIFFLRGLGWVAGFDFIDVFSNVYKDIDFWRQRLIYMREFLKCTKQPHERNWKLSQIARMVTIRVPVQRNGWVGTDRLMPRLFWIFWRYFPWKSEKSQSNKLKMVHV